MSIKQTFPAQVEPAPHTTYTIPPAMASSGTPNAPKGGYGKFTKPTPATPFPPSL